MKINSGQASSTLIPEYIGSDFDKVITVADNLNDIKPVSENINDVVTVADNILNVNKVITSVNDVALVADNIDYVKDVAEGIEGLPVSGYIGDTPPTQPKVGATWYCTLDGRNYTWYEDTDSGQWVESSPQSTADDPHLAGNIFTLWKRSAAEAGYTLVVGSFEEGGVLTSSTDVLWHKGLDSIYSWGGAFPKTVAPGTDPAAVAGYVPRTDVALRSELAGDGGTSLIGAGNGRTQDDVNNDHLCILDYPGVDKTGVTDSTAGVLACLTDASNRGKRVFVPNGRYKINKADGFNLPFVHLFGESTPVVADDELSISSGPVFVGKLKMRGNVAILHNIGAEPTTDADDAISVSYALPPSGGANVGDYCELINVIGMCKSSTTSHGVLFEGYKKAHVSNITGVRGLFAIAAKCQNITGSGINGYYGGSACAIIKSDSSFGDCDNVSLSGFRLKGLAAATTNHLWILANGAQMERVVVDGVVADGYSGSCVKIQNTTVGTSTLNDVSVANVISTGSDTALSIAAEVALYNFSMSESIFVNLAKQGSLIAGDVREATISTSSFGLKPTGAVPTGRTIEVDASVPGVVKIFDCCGTIGRSYAAQMGVLFNNASALNEMTGNGFYASGVGAPRKGFANQVVKGVSSITVTPVNGYDDMVGVIRVKGDQNLSVTAISVRNDKSIPLTPGTKLHIINDSGFTVTIPHNPTAGGRIYNKGGASVVINPNEVAEYVFGSYLWHQA